VKLVIDNSVAMRWLFADGSEADRQYASEVAALVETSEVHVDVGQKTGLPTRNA
jgi:hypothetical protein